MEPQSTPEIPEEPAKVKLERPANWGQPGAISDELSFRPSKSATKRRALEKAIAVRQLAARLRKPKKKQKQEEIPMEEDEGPQIDPDWLDQFYYIQDNALATRCRYAFMSNDSQRTGKLDLEQMLTTLARVNPKLSDQETFYMTRVSALKRSITSSSTELAIFRSWNCSALTCCAASISGCSRSSLHFRFG